MRSTGRRTPPRWARFVTFAVALLVLLPIQALRPSSALAASSSLTIIKTRGENDSAGTPIEGIRFQLNRIDDVDAHSPQQVQDLVASDPSLLVTGSHALGQPVIAVTDAQGHATATGLPDGVYLVQELPSRTGDVGWSVVTPFLVALPARDGSGPDVQVHAKNQPLALQVEAPSVAGPDCRVEVRLVANVPAPDVRGQLHRYVLVFGPQPAWKDAQLAGLSLQQGDHSEALTRGQDFTVTTDQTTGDLVMQFTQTGLDRLAKARSGHPETRVVATLNGLVPSAPMQRSNSVAVLAHLFTDGWPVPAHLTQAEQQAGATGRASVQLDGRGCAPSPTPTPTPEPTPAPTPAPTDPTSPWHPHLPHTGAEGAASAALGVVAIGLLLFWLLRRSRREDDVAATPNASRSTTSKDDNA